MLESAIAGTASLRFYTWTSATLSLGYFQPHAVRLADARLAALPWVRRPTGGETLVHHHELTYALALPAGPPWQAPGASWLGRMHAIIAAALAGFGAAAEGVARESRLGATLCFLHHTPADLRIGAAKVVGSAQRRQRGALLQHGAVLLAASPFAPSLPGVAELTGRELSTEELMTVIRDLFTRDAGWALNPAEWTEAERRRIETLAAQKYSRPAWNEKR